MPGVTVGKGSIIAAGSIVTTSIPKESVVAGNPARIISTLSEYKEKIDMQFKNGINPTYDKDFTISGEITKEIKRTMYEELNNKKGFVV